MKTSDTSGAVLGVIGGLATGYVLWLVAFSIAGDNAAVGPMGRQRRAPEDLIHSDTGRKP
jgi:hypothetical protein